MAITTVSQSQLGQETAKNSQIVTTAVRLVNSGASTGPSITSIIVTDSGYNNLDDTAAATSNSYIRILGTGFTSTANVFLNGTMVPKANVTFVSSSELRAVLPVSNTGNYAVSVYNSNSSGALYSSSFVISTMPQWLTSTTLANVTSNVVFSNTLSATSDSPITYSNTSILPTGFTLLANGYYFGNISVGATTTYSFDIKATDTELQDTTRTFNLTTINLPPTYTVDYLVVGGGGGGGYAGGGAGGFASGTTTVNKNQSYPVTVGAGGGFVFGNYSEPTAAIGNGSDSTVFAITGSGGGGGGAGGSPQPAMAIGKNGGSGGGGYRTFIPGPNVFFPRDGGTSTQFPGFGFSGGFGGGDINGQAGGGGGGAGGAGQPAQPNGAPFNKIYVGGRGGNARTWPVDGLNYAEGGFGLGYGPGSPGTGGGGSDGAPATIPSGPSGGYGSGGPGNSPGAQGIVVIAMPTPNYPGSAPGATVTTPPAAPGKTVLTYTSSGIFTA